MILPVIFFIFLKYFPKNLLREYSWSEIPHRRFVKKSFLLREYSWFPTLPSLWDGDPETRYKIMFLVKTPVSKGNAPQARKNRAL